MKSICAVLGLALLMGCGNSNNDCPRKEKDCGKNNMANQVETPAAEQKEVAQEAVPTLENLTPSK